MNIIRNSIQIMQWKQLNLRQDSILPIRRGPIYLSHQINTFCFSQRSCVNINYVGPISSKKNSGGYELRLFVNLLV